VASRIPIPVFGAGLAEAVPDGAIEAQADPTDRDRDGISGRAALVRDLVSDEVRVGRFGWKAQHATLKAFSADADRGEMGISDDKLRRCDPIPDPEDVPDPRTGVRHAAIHHRTLGQFALRSPPGAALRAALRAFLLSL